MALVRAAELRCTAVQIFTQSARQWGRRRLSAEEIRAFRQMQARLGPIAVVAHAGYLLNLAAAERALRERSVRALIGELERCEALGIPSLVLHPGAHVGAGEARGITRVAAALRRAHAATPGFAVKTVLENTAGQGSSLGPTVAQLAAIMDAAGDAGRLGLCIDTAHAFAAGYDLRTPEGYSGLWDEVARLIGSARLAVVHLNDARRELGSRVDRHAHIGQGYLGRQAFARILSDPYLAAVPKIIETPKEGDMDHKNLGLLRRLASAPRHRRGAPGGS
jgi:deoxyribonuclease-4